MRWVLVILLLVACAGPGPVRLREADHVRVWCKGVIEARLSDGTRVDCLTDTHAIEVDWAREWMEGVGQSLHYAEVSNLWPGLALIVKKNRPGSAADARHVERARVLTTRHGIKLWIIEVDN